MLLFCPLTTPSPDRKSELLARSQANRAIILQETENLQPLGEAMAAGENLARMGGPILSLVASLLSNSAENSNSEPG